MKNNLAPVALFVFKRLEHTKITVKSLLENPEAINTDLYIFSDAWLREQDRSAVNDVRSYVAGISGFKSVNLILRPFNFGLSKSIISGVSEVLTKFNDIIVLEDDMMVSRYFLSYMNNSLNLFKPDERVISIHGYIYPVKKNVPEAFFLRGADCWGWATWRRGWALFNPDGQYLLEELKRRNLLKEFDYNDSYGYSHMLESQIKGENDSWAVRWYASAFLADKLTLYPGRSLLHNIGNDNSGTHCGSTLYHDTVLSNSLINLTGVEVKPSEIARTAFEQFFRQSKGNFFSRISFRIKHALRKALICIQ